MLARLLLLGLLIPSGLTPLHHAESEALEEASGLLRAKSYPDALELLEGLIARDGQNPRVHELLGDALLGLERDDAAAHRYDIALRLLRDAGNAKDIKRLTRSLQRADPLETHRARLRRDATSRLYKAAKKLFEMGNTERALEAIDSMQPLAEGKDASKLLALLEKIRSSTEQVDLDQQSKERADGEAWPLVTFESEHYVFKANLELEVVELVAATMDDIHGYYVELYLDGDEKAVSGSPATIRIHGTRASMLEDWTGGTAPEGWWSPGQNRVTCYDTRVTTGSLDWMLETLFHEASHQFMTQLESKGGRAPAWLNEGTASFFEGATAMADHRVLWPDAALKRLNSLLAMLAGSRQGPTLEQVLRFSEPGSYPGEYYAWGWGIVYFMQQYEDPATLEHVYRPLYATYRERITARGGESMKLFEETFLGKNSPLEHESLSEFERDWRSWITDEIAPLHRAAPAQRRERRRALVDRYVQAAESARGNRKAPVDSDALLARALGHVEYIRKQIDGEEHDTDVDLIRLQVRILTELDRPRAAAPLVELLLELADNDTWAPSNDDYDDLVEQLSKLDKGNWALRNVTAARRTLVRSATALFERYLKADPPARQRALTLASRFSAGLADEDSLQAAADRLRHELRDSGQLVGIPNPLFAPRSRWSTIYSEGPKKLSVAPDSLLLSNVRPHGQIQTALLVGDEYVLHGTLVREGEIHRSTTHGLVIAATEDSDWLVFGLQKSGRAALWHLSRRPGDGVNTRQIRSIMLSTRPPDEGEIQLRIHVRNGEWIRIQVDDAEEIEVAYPANFRRARHVGLYVKDGTTRIENGLVETFD